MDIKYGMGRIIVSTVFLILMHSSDRGCSISCTNPFSYLIFACFLPQFVHQFDTLYILIFICFGMLNVGKL